MLLSPKLEQDGEFFSGRDWPSMSCKKCVSKRSWRPSTSVSVSITAATSTQWIRRTNGQKLGKKCFRVVRFSSKKCVGLLLPDDDGLLWRVFPLSQHSVAEKRVLRLVFRSNYIFPIFIFDKFRWKKLLWTDFRVFRKNFWFDPKPGNHDFFSLSSLLRSRKLILFFLWNLFFSLRRDFRWDDSLELQNLWRDGFYFGDKSGHFLAPFLAGFELCDDFQQTEIFFAKTKMKQQKNQKFQSTSKHHENYSVSA